MGDHLRRERLDRGLTQRTLARELGVREETVRLWETGRARPLPRHFGRIVRFLGYDPGEPGTTLGERIRAARYRQGLSQGEFAVLLGVDEGTMVDLEGDRRRPSRRPAVAVSSFLAHEGEAP